MTPDGGPSRGRTLAGLALGAALLGLFALQLWTHATRTSPTLDEPYFILAGYEYWQCGDAGFTEHPPLAKLLAAWPIHSWQLAGPPWPCGSQLTPLAEGYQAGTRFVLENGIDRVVLPGRLASSLVSLALAALVAFAALEMFGRAEALVALALVGFEPTLVAHGSLASTDMLLTAGLFAAAYAFYRYGSRPSAVLLLPAGLAVGVALASKFSALVAAPVVCALPLVDVALAAKAAGMPRAALSRRAAAAVAAGAAAGLVGLAVLWACYGFRYHALPGVTADATSVEAIIRSSPHPEAIASAAGRIAASLQHLRLVPESYAYGFASLAGYGERPTYLLGARFPTGQWFYFPVAFLIKTSIPLLALLAVALGTRELCRRRRREMLYLLVPSVAYFALSMTSGVNIGIRHVLPVYPFFAVVAAAGACYWARRSRVAFWVVAALIVFHAVTAARTLPNDIAFANDLWGGTSNSYRLLHDSNCDWGQNLKAVAKYLDREQVGECWFACYGNGELASAVVPRCHLLPAPGWANGDTPVEPVPPVIEGTVLVSASVLADPSGAVYAPITSTEPVAVIGGGVLVYRGRFEVPLLSAFGRIDRAGQLARLGRIDEARGELKAVVAAARANPAALGPAVDEARRALEQLP